MISPEPRTLLFFSTVLILLFAKVTMLMVSGPMAMPDTGAYHSFAETILSDRSWITNAGLAGGVEPPTAYRMVGYPALIALAIRLAGSGWGWVLASLQIVLSVLATVRLFALRRPLGLGPHAMIFAVVAYATTEPLVLDPSLLTDSLNASLIILAVTAMILAATSDRHLRPLAALGSGLLLAAAFLLREATTFLSLGMLPLMAVAIGLVRNDRMSPGPTGASALARRLAAGVLLLLPLAATHAAYSSWNKQRTGTAFITTGGQTAMLLPLVEAAARDPQIFSGDAPLDKAANHSLSRYGYDEVLAINGQLFADWHMTAPEISAAVYGKYVSSWREHPGTMSRVFLAHLRENQLFLLFRPVDSLREYILWATGRQTDLGRWKSVAADIRFLPLFVADAVCKTISVALFLAFLLVTPWRALREREGFALQRGCLCLWMLYLTWFSTYALVHLDTRYMAPVLPFAILIGTANLSWVLRRTWREIGRKPVETERAR